MDRRSPARHVEIVEVAPQTCAVVRARTTVAELPLLFQRVLDTVLHEAERQAVAVTGPPFGVYPAPPDGIFEAVVGFPTSMPISATAEAEPFVRPGGRAAVTIHVGPYDTVGETYATLQAWMTAEGLSGGPQVWEEYLFNPHEEPDPAAWRTRLVWPLAPRS